MTYPIDPKQSIKPKQSTKPTQLTAKAKEIGQKALEILYSLSPFSSKKASLQENEIVLLNTPNQLTHRISELGKKALRT